MQALILADMKKSSTNCLTRYDPDCMIQIDGISIIERMLKQLDKNKVSKVIIVVGHNKEKIIGAISDLKLKAEIVILENDSCEETGSIYSLFLAKDLLLLDDTVILNAQMIVEDSVLESILNEKKECNVLVDTDKNWMTGETVSIGDDERVLSFGKKKISNTYSSMASYKMVGICKFDRTFAGKYYIPVLETMTNVLGNSLDYSAPLNVIAMSEDVKIRALYIGNAHWREINNIEDINQATILFSKDKKSVADKMLGSWGGYWRYPDYLDYFYLVTPYYPPCELVEELQNNFKALLEQYPSGMRVNAELAASAFGISPESIIVGNGAAELIKSMMGFIKGKTGFVRPTFDEYPNRYTEIETVNYLVESEDFSYSASDLIEYFGKTNISNLVLVNPDNPSGNYIPKGDMMRMISWARDKDIKVIIDESFVDFSDEIDSSLIDQETLNRYPNLYVIKSISKSYGVPGLRLGVLASGDKKLISRMKTDVSIWNINSFAEFYMQICGKYRGSYVKSLEKFKKERNRFVSKLQELGCIRVIPSQANYLMVELLDDLDAEELKQRMLLEQKVFIKTLSKKIKGKKQYLRIAIRNEADNDMFVQKLTETLNTMLSSENRIEKNV